MPRLDLLFALLLRTSREERGDVPGWVLITAMTVALVMLLWGIASEALRDIVTRFLNEVRFD
jgi:hypothetical protein